MYNNTSKMYNNNKNTHCISNTQTQQQTNKITPIYKTHKKTIENPSTYYPTFKDVKKTQTTATEIIPQQHIVTSICKSIDIRKKILIKNYTIHIKYHPAIPMFLPPYIAKQTQTIRKIHKITSHQENRKITHTHAKNSKIVGGGIRMKNRFNHRYNLIGTELFIRYFRYTKYTDNLQTHKPNTLTKKDHDITHL